MPGKPRWPTIGFKFKHKKISYTGLGRTDALSFLLDIASTMSRGQVTEHMLERNRARSVEIPTFDVEATDFHISKEKIHLLYKYGYRSAMDFMKTWDFREYVRKYRRC